MRQIAVLIFLVFNIFAFGQPPTIHASNLKLDFEGCNETKISWTNGNGSFRAVFMREIDNISDVPEYKQFYTDDPVFGQGEDIKDDNKHFCIYKGPDNYVTVKGLKKNTKYCFAVFEYNGGGGNYDYLTTSPFPEKCYTTKNITADFKITDSTGYDSAQQCLYVNKFKFINKSTGDITPLTYEWDFNDGSAISTVKDPTHVYKIPQIMQVKLTVRSTGCITNVVINDTVHPHPVAKFDLDPSKPKNTSVQCYFANRFTFRNSTSLQDIGAGFSFMRYEWYEYPKANSNDSFFATGYKADRNFSKPGSITVKLVVISNKGCRDSAYATYTVLPRAIDPSKVVFNEKSMCLSNNKFIFQNNSPNSVSSNWRIRDTLQSKDMDSVFANPGTYTFNKIGAYYITLKAYDKDGCLDQDTTLVDVFKNTNVSFKTKNDIYDFCVDDPVVQLIPTPGKGEFKGVNVGTDSTFTPKAVGAFNVEYISTIGGCRDTARKTITVYGRPDLDLGSDTIICKDNPLQLNVDPKFTNITWGTLSPNQIIATGKSFINISQSGNYWVRAYEGLCYDSTGINVTSLNTPTLSIDYNDTTLCGGSYLRFSLKVDDGNVSWSDGNNSKDRIISQTGFYKVTVSNKCATLSDSFNLNVEETACIVFFPNAFTPNGDVLNDTWQPYGKYDFIKMHIFNRWGEQVYFSDKSPVWDGYNDKDLCLDGVYNCVFEYLVQDGNTKRKVTDGLIIHLVR